MTNYQSSITHFQPYSKLLKKVEAPFTDVKTSKSLVGCLQYLTFTRPNIAYSVISVSQFMQSPIDLHFQAIKRILRYIKGIMNYGLILRPSPLELRAYTNSDWEGDPNDRCRITGFVIFLGNCPISWYSKKQTSVSRSSTQAEYRAMAHTTSEVVWIRHLLNDLHVQLPSAPTLHCDNVSALALASNPIHNSRVKPTC